MQMSYMDGASGWLATIIAIALAFAVVHAVSDSTLADSLAFAIASFAVRELDQNFVPSSKRLSMRIVCFTVMMSGFILYSAYAATMTSFLSISLKTPSIATFEDVLNSGKTSLLLILLEKHDFVMSHYPSDIIL